MLYIFIDYYSGDLGGVCNNENEVIRSIEECSKAISKLDFEVSELSISDFWRGHRSDIPSGCSIRDRGKKPHMNFKEAMGVGTGRRDLIPICKLGSYIGRSFIFIIYS